MEKLSKTIENFLKYSYNGNGKYYTYSKGGQRYNQSEFQKFANKNKHFFNITKSGNDAPKGGKLGDFVIVEFTEDFTNLIKPFLDAKIEQQRIESKNQSEYEANRLAQINKFSQIMNKERATRYLSKVQAMSSHKWRNWLRMKAAKHINDGKFDGMVLSAPELLSIVNDFAEIK